MTLVSVPDFYHFFYRCHSKIGRKFGKQLILLDRDDCSSFGKIAHEMMHTVGLRHEHNRPDRDDYIQVLFEDLPPGGLRCDLFFPICYTPLTLHSGL